MVKEDLGQRAIELHRKARGKLEVRAKVDCSNSKGLSLAYTPGVAAVSNAVAKDPSLAYELTMKWNSVAVVSDGSRVLGLGNIGPLGAMPVMEGKAALFKSYANVDAFPLCLSCKSADDIVSTVLAISPTFGGINLEDIESPKCFEVEDRLKELLDIPVFHDDQHGTGVVALSGLLNALEVVGKRKESAKVVVGGAGAAGFGITKMLLEDGFSNILVCDRKGIIVDEEGTADKKRELAAMTNKSGQNGSLQDALKGADAFIGVSGPNSLQKEWIKEMEGDPIIFTLSNPVPEIDPIVAEGAGAKVVGTARSDYPNQVNNVLGFPGIFRGALMVRSREINEEMKVAAAHALAGLISKEELNPNNVLPLPFDRRVAPSVAMAVAKASMESGSARLNLTQQQLKDELSYLGLG